MRRAAIALVLALLAFSALAQQMPKPRLWAVHIEVVKPSRVAEYEAGTKEMLDVFRASKIDSAGTRFTGMAMDRFEYVYIIPLSNFAAFDSLIGDWMEAEQKIGKAKWEDMGRRGGANIDYYRELVVMERADLSYHPANPRVKPEEAPFFHSSFYFILPGREREAESIGRDYVETFRKKNLDVSFTTYQAILGDEMPLFIVSSPAKDMTDWVATNNRVNQLLGAEGVALARRAMAVTRKFEERHGQLRPDLSYSGPEPMSKPAK